MNVIANLERIRAFAARRRGNLKRLARRAGVSYSTAVRMEKPDWCPSALVNFEKMVEAVDALEQGESEPAEGEGAA
jgi:hypothetical protein